MKKLFIGLMALALTFTASLALTGCGLGFKEIDFEDIPKAKLYDEYTYETVTYTKANDQSTTTKGELTGEGVRASIATAKTAFELIKAVDSKSYCEVKANGDYSKIVTYYYRYNSDNELITRTITTYKKK